VRVVPLPDRVVVAGFRAAGDRHGFRAEWLRGRANGATWHEPRYRYAMIDDPRPVGVSKRDRVALANRRAAGVAHLHMRIVASPVGVKISFAELTERISA
jgi:hypothetical protein